jgi:hypothetical protein
MVNVLGPYPLCAACAKTNGGLVSVRHEQVHVRAYGKESCVDRGLAGLMVHLWRVCDTFSCCEESGGLAYVVASADTAAAAVDLLERLGLEPRVEQGHIRFRVLEYPRLDDAEAVGQALEGRPRAFITLRVNDGGEWQLE